MIRLKQLLKEQNLKPYIKSTDWLGRITWNYPAIEKCTNAKDLAEIIKKANGTFQDDEAAAEAAFMAITNYDTDINNVERFYELVGKSLGQDPYAFVKGYMSDTSFKYHKQPIDVSIKRLTDLISAQNEFELSNDDLRTHEFPALLIRRYGEERTRAYKRRAKEAFRDAKQWWSTYLSLPETQINFDYNQLQHQKYHIIPTSIDDIVKLFTGIPYTHKNVFPKYIKHLPKIKLKFSYQPAVSAFAWVDPWDITILHVNIAPTFNYGSSLKMTMVHEIQHMLFEIYPLNPDENYVAIGSETPIKSTIEIDATVRQNMNNAVKLLKPYGIDILSLHIWKIAAEKLAEREDPGYTCRDNEQGSRVEGIRSKLPAGEQLQPKHFAPYIRSTSMSSPVSADYQWIIACWVQQGFPDFTQYLNGLNALVKNDSDSKKPETIKLKSLVPPQTT